MRKLDSDAKSSTISNLLLEMVGLGVLVMLLVTRLVKVVAWLKESV